jgi:hypothetical protein
MLENLVGDRDLLTVLVQPEGACEGLPLSAAGARQN